MVCISVELGERWSGADDFQVRGLSAVPPRNQLEFRSKNAFSNGVSLHKAEEFHNACGGSPGPSERESDEWDLSPNSFDCDPNSDAIEPPHINC